MEQDLQWKVGPEQVLFSTGAKQSLINVLMAVLNPWDEVLLPAPYWVSYTGMIQMAEAKAVVLPSSAESGYKISAEALEAAITPRTRMLLYSSPCNPSQGDWPFRRWPNLCARGTQRTCVGYRPWVLGGRPGQPVAQSSKLPR